ncbi:NAD(P)H-dependent oxidoreductase [Paraburkholderia pallida]|uniref:Flavodoxin family protein n=1 Tax=Paraburkholderia pallida TaxID=2547399 RepID=A0A4P7D9K6_9BURK|nr:NAD(P)H-dependent oxidoreductase [Paraburkholderia pallida]QBR03930.1 flavodoxin family protein [Paraburkholderia pallida]
MNILIVHAHPELKSFTSALKSEAVEVLRGLGHQVEISDLYASDFVATASASDFADRTNPEYLVYALEQRNAVARHTLSADIEREIERVKQCDLLILTFPLFWFSMPAILKGWIDRVFVSGVFYGGRRIYDQGGMVGKKALVCTTLGGREHMVTEGGIHGDLKGMLRPLLQGTLGYAGFEVLEPFFAYHVPYVEQSARQKMLEDWKALLLNIDSRATLAMPSLADYDETLAPRAKLVG